MIKKNLLAVFIFAFVFILLSSKASAAEFKFSTPSNSFNIGDTFDVDILADTEGVSINAAQATIQFPYSILQVVSIEKSSSIFNFWLEEPSFSNESGTLSFVGGSSSGFSGLSLKVLKIKFKAKGEGTADVGFLGGMLTASDGSGANVLSKMQNLKIVVSQKGAISPQIEPIVAPPVQIERKPVIAEILPAKPNLEVLLYADSEKWYNLSSVFTVKWDLPLDITGVATIINKIPDYNPEKSKGLFDNESFEPLDDGIWYLHVRFQNNVGWGKTAHWKISIDTAPPLGFKINTVDGEAFDNPTPTFEFITNDALSGIKEYQVRIGNGDVIKISAKDFKGSFRLPLQAPGKRQVLVRAVDLAGNGAEDIVSIDVLAITSPSITFVTKELFSDEEKDLTVKGTALPNVDVLLKAYLKGTFVADGIVRSDEKGNWEFTFDQAFRNGKHTVTAQSRDSRGALSNIVESPKILVKSKPIIQIGNLQLGKDGALIFFIFVIAGGFWAGAWFYKKRQKKNSVKSFSHQI